ncbi:MAG: transcription elongation factor GreA [Candidatus Liptonbacteria bacterium]|nr:transcription elongation factor GreA [Candidatus Liptonbacteria bacterium]
MYTYYLTKERLEELKGELEELKTKKRLEVAERLKAAKEYGDLSENSEYTEAREEQARAEQRILELEDLFKKAVVIKKKDADDKVRIGSTIVVNRSDKVFTYQIVGSNETRPEEGKISNASPLGRAFLGHRVGDSVTIHAPSGPVIYKITKIG